MTSPKSWLREVSIEQTHGGVSRPVRPGSPSLHRLRPRVNAVFYPYADTDTGSYRGAHPYTTDTYSNIAPCADR